MKSNYFLRNIRMRDTILVSSYIFCFIVATLVSEPLPDAARFWPEWRGPQATGVAPHGTPPLKWSETKNIRWKLQIPGKGSATPIVWDDRLFVLTATPVGEVINPPESKSPHRARWKGDKPNQAQTFSILAISRQDGKVLWERTVRTKMPHEGTHVTGTWASCSPVTDGELVFAYFGSQGLYAFNMQGELLWEKDLGDMTIRYSFGEGASPTLHEDRIIVSWDHEGQSFIVALDKRTGKEIWRVDRDEKTSWTTPIVVTQDGRKQVIISATKRVRSYDFRTGELVWESSGMTLNTIPSPVAADGIVFVTSGFRGNALLAIRLANAKGDITDSDSIIWSHDRDTPYVPSPLLYDETLYFLKHNSGVLSSFDAKTGEMNYQTRLTDVPNVYASPVGAADRVYVTGREGKTVVLQHPEFKILAVNSLEDGFDASPAVVDNEIYLRGRRFLYCISQD